MSCARLFTVGLSLHLLALSSIASDVHFEGGQGQLAIQSAKVPEWRILQATDAVDSPSQLRTSAQGPTKLALPEGELILGADTSAELNAAEHTIVLRRGRARLIVAESATLNWRLTSGQQTAVCPNGAEIAVTSGRVRPVTDLLNGRIEIQQNDQNNKVIGTYTAPLENVTGDGERPDIATMKGGVEAWRKRARAATEIRATQGLGQLVATDAQSGSPVRLEVARYHVNVVLQPPVALVQIDQSFFNPYPTQQEGTFVFNLPGGASVSRFAMYVTRDSLIEGELIERERADAIYTSIVRKRRDPAILEQIGDNLFRMRVFPVFAKDTKRILLDYTVPLVADHGGFAFNLPLMSDLKPIWDFSLNGTIHPPFAANTVQSATHPKLKFSTTEDGSITFSAKSEQTQPPSHFALRYSAPLDPQPVARTYKPTGETDQYFVLTVPAQLASQKAKSDKPLDLLLLVDTAGPSKSLAAAFQAARSVAAGLKSTDRIRIGCVDASFRPISQEWSPPDSDETDAAWRLLAQQFALGNSNLQTTLEQALLAFKDSPPERRKLVVYIGEGPTPAEGEQSPAAPEAAPSLPYEFSAVSLSSSQKRSEWLTRKVTAACGRLFELGDLNTSPGELFEWSVSGYPAPIQVKEVQVAGIEAANLYFDQTWLQDQEFHIYGRGPASNKLQTVIVTDGKPISLTAKVSARMRTEDVFTGRSWASRRLRHLLRTVDLRAAAGQREIVRLCQEWSLMSPLTAFLVLETEHDYTVWNVDRKIRRRYWNPQGAVTATALPANITRPPQQSNVPPVDTAGRNHAQRVLRQVEADLSRGNSSHALKLLASIHRDAMASDPDKYQSLKRQADALQRPLAALPELKLWRPLADRSAVDLVPPIAVPLLGITDGGPGAEFLEIHPHSRELLRNVPDCPVEMSVEDFPKYIRKLTGLPVLLDRVAIQDEGFSFDHLLDLNGLDGITVRSLMREALESYGLQYIAQPHLIKITTKAKANETFHNHVYPVGDLLSKESLPPPNSLRDPYLEIEEAARRRLSEKLKHVISVDFQKTPLNVAARSLGELLGSPIRIDSVGLADEGISPDRHVEMQLDNVPADVVLNNLLEPLGLVVIIQNETIKIVTAARADETFDTRLYSTLGIEELTTESSLQRRRRQFGFGMMGMGGFGGMLGGMPGGGMGGGLGGAMGGGMGGMGIGMGGPAPAAAEAQSNSRASVEPFDIAAANMPDLDEASPDEVLAPEVAIEPNTSPAIRITASADNLMQLAQQTTSGKWMQIDQEGGAVEYFPPARSLVVRQTSKVHHEIRETLKQLRRNVTTPWPQVSSEVAWIDPDSQFRSLANLIQQCQGGKWIDIDQEGGAIQANLPTSTMTIRQTAAMHEEVYGLLTQLRRARYNNDLGWSLTSLTTIDDAPAVGWQTVTRLPPNSHAAVTAKPDELKWLAARHVPNTLDQRWRSRSLATGVQREFSVRSLGRRLELILPERTVRAEAQRAAFAYPGLALVEIDNWGDAGRQQVDAALPWLPHRSNEELAELFDVSFAAEDSQSVTLRLGFPGMTDTYLQATFSKLTRLPVRWRSVAGGQPQFELEFDTKRVIARDHRARELERWDLIAEARSEPIPALDRGWPEALVVDISEATANQSPPDQPENPRVEQIGSLFVEARRALGRGDFANARQLLDAALQIQPEQPLLNLLRAWTAEFATQKSDAEQRIRREALVRVCRSNAEELIRFITPVSFPSLSLAAIHDIYLSVPEPRRSGEVWARLSANECAAGHFDIALSFIEKGLAGHLSTATRNERLVMKVDLLLRTGKQSDAVKLAQTMTSASDRQLLQLADLFSGADLRDVQDKVYEQVRERSRATGTDLVSLIERQADSHPLGKRRWELLLEAQAATAGDPHDRMEFVELILNEATTGAHALILRELAAAQEDKSIRTQLKLIEADLLDDRQRAAEIVLELTDAGQIDAMHRYWALRVLEDANRPADVVRLVESRLRRGESIDLPTQLVLRDAYIKLERASDAQRADDERFRQVAPARPALPRLLPAGTGFFNVK